MSYKAMDSSIQSINSHQSNVDHFNVFLLYGNAQKGYRNQYTGVQINAILILLVIRVDDQQQLLEVECVDVLYRLTIIFRGRQCLIDQHYRSLVLDVFVSILCLIDPCLANVLFLDSPTLNDSLNDRTSVLGVLISTFFLHVVDHSARKKKRKQHGQTRSICNSHLHFSILSSIFFRMLSTLHL